MAAPFLPDGFAVSESTATPGGGTRTFVILEGSNTDLKDGYMVQAEAIEDADQWMVGQWERTDATNGKLHMLGDTSGRDYAGSTEFNLWRLKVVDTPRDGLPLAGLDGLRVELVETEKVADPATLPASTGRGAAISPDDLTLAVAHDNTPFVTIYRRTAASADDWTKVSDPATLPASHGFDCVISPDGLTLAVAHSTTPFVTIYRRTATSADDWTKVADPATLPAGNGIGVAISPDGLTLVVGHSTTPFVTIYRRTSAAADDWTKVANPASLPASTARHPAISPDGLTLAVPHNTTPFVTIYRRTAVGADDWTKIADPASLPASNGFAATVSPDGLTLAVAHEATPFVTIYRRSAVGADDWTKVTNPAALPASHAHGCVIFPDGLVLAVAHDTTPFVTLYRRSAVDADDWTKVTNPVSLPTESGTSCAISSDGLTLAVSHGTTPFVTIYRNPDAGTLIYINRGAVRSYDDSVNIVNEEAGAVRIHRLYENDGLMIRAALTGTGTSAGTALTGTSTTFVTDFGSGTAQASLDDYDEQIDGLLRGLSVVTAGATSSGVASVTTNTALVTVSALGASASALKRGGYSMETGTIYLGVGVARNDADGSATRFITALTGSGTPDLPSGHTPYRIVAVIKLVDGVVTEVLQPLTGQSVPDADEIDYDNTDSGAAAENVQDAIDDLFDLSPKAVFRAIVTPTLLTGNISAVDTGTEEITWSVDLRAQVRNNADVFTIIPAVGGTWPTGATTRGLLYGAFVGASSTIFALYLTLADAEADTNRINLTAAGSGTRTAHHLVLTGVLSHGMHADCPIGGHGTYATALGFALNFDGTFTATNALVDMNVHGLITTAGTDFASHKSTVPMASTQSAAQAIYLAADIPSTIVGAGSGSAIRTALTWVGQTTTLFRVQAVTWA
jgi:hypothetical protein